MSLSSNMEMAASVYSPSCALFGSRGHSWSFWCILHDYSSLSAVCLPMHRGPCPVGNTPVLNQRFNLALLPDCENLDKSFSFPWGPAFSSAEWERCHPSYRGLQCITATLYWVFPVCQVQSRKCSSAHFLLTITLWELSTRIRMLYIRAVQHGGHRPHEATKYL